jgi:uncharacterized membrane protein
MGESNKRVIIASSIVEEYENRIKERSSRRLVALSDGIFAFAMTLLVLDIKPPSVPVDQLPVAIFNLWPHFFCYLISFALLGVYWSSQAAQYQFVQKVDQTYIWLNIGFLAVVVLVPFSTGLLSQDPFTFLTLMIYGFNLILIGVMLYWMWAHATGRHRLVDADVPPGVVRYSKWRSLLPPTCYVIAIIAAIYYPYVSLAIFALTPMLFIIPGLHKYWLRLVE